jgi:amino acid adenylation domain-containing protein
VRQQGGEQVPILQPYFTSMTFQTSIPINTPTQELVASVMEDVLLRTGIGASDDFFSLGGNSIQAALVAVRLARLTATRVPLHAIFEAPTVSQLTAWLDAAERTANSALAAIPHRTDQTRAPVLPMQRWYWLNERLEIGNASAIRQAALRLRGALNTTAFARAFAEIVSREHALRTVFGESESRPVQMVLPAIPAPPLQIEDLRLVVEPDRQATLGARLEALALMPFDLTRAPLFRAHLFRIADDEHVFYFSAHAAIWDRQSFDALTAALQALYASYAKNELPSPPLPTMTHGEFALWYLDWLQTDEALRQIAVWKARTTEPIELLSLPGDQPRPHRMSGAGTTRWLSLSAQSAQCVAKLARSTNVTPFIAYLSAYTLLLFRLTGQRHIVVGIPSRAWRLAELPSALGQFENTLVVRLRVDPDFTVAGFLNGVRESFIAAIKHVDVPIDVLARESNIPRDSSGFPLYQASFSMHQAHEELRDWNGLKCEMLQIECLGAEQDINLSLTIQQDALIGALTVNADILSAATAERICEHYAHIVTYIASQPSTSLSNVPLPPSEILALEAVNATGTPVAGATTIHHRCMAGVPDSTALIHDRTQLTYAALSTRVNRLAHALVHRGAKRGDRVGLCIEHGIDMVVGLLAILNTGAAYVPLDPSYPRDRLRFMADDAQIAILLTHSKLLDLVVAPRTLLVDWNAAEIDAQPATPLPIENTDPDDCAYVIYTSGTTGEPKGVMVPHYAVINFLQSMAKEPGLTRADRLIAVTTLSFDIAVLELLLPLAVGATVVIASRDIAADPNALASLIRETDATILQSTPSTWRMLLDAGWRGHAGLKALVGGEALPPELAARLIPLVKEVWNMYGPTETTVWSTCARITDPAAGIPIGRPIINTQVHVLDALQRPCPIGVPGEIWIGGRGVALGYLHRPALTAERFVRDWFSDAPNARLYRTGDRGRWRADLQLEHLGRNDFQIKVRGHRIEPGEIETRLSNHPAVRQAVVAAREISPGNERLIAYIVPDGKWPAGPALREYLRSWLPAYMLPHHFMQIPSLPLLQNGKIDHAALPLPGTVDETQSARGGERPSTESEKQLWAIWQDLLKTRDITTQDNFFDIGGDSLLAMQAMVAMEAKTGKRVDRSRYIFETLGQIARAYDEASARSSMPLGKLWALLGDALRKKNDT